MGETCPSERSHWDKGWPYRGQVCWSGASSLQGLVLLPTTPMSQFQASRLEGGGSEALLDFILGCKEKLFGLSGL